MRKEEMAAQAQETLSALETANIIRMLREMSMATLIENPAILLLLVVVFFYAVVKKSKFVLLFLFALLSLTLLIQYSLPAPDAPLAASSFLPFTLGSLGIGVVLIYFIFIRSE